MFRDTHHGKLCPYCDRVMDRASVRLQATRDHVVPRCRGGGATVVACITCNGIKGNMLPEVWETFMAANPRWWLLSKYELRLIRRSDLGLTSVPRKRGVRIILKGIVRRQPTVVPPELIYGHSQPATERNDQ